MKILISSLNRSKPSAFVSGRGETSVAENPKDGLSVSNHGRSADILSAVSPIFNRQRVAVPGRVEHSGVSGLQIRDTAECNSALRPWLDDAIPLGWKRATPVLPAKTTSYFAKAAADFHRDEGNDARMNRSKFRQVLDCASPLALFVGQRRSQSARGLAQSKTLARGGDDSWNQGALKTWNIEHRTPNSEFPALNPPVYPSGVAPASRGCEKRVVAQLERSAGFQPAFRRTLAPSRLETGAPALVVKIQTEPLSKKRKNLW